MDLHAVAYVPWVTLFHHRAHVAIVLLFEHAHKGKYRTIRGISMGQKGIRSKTYIKCHFWHFYSYI